MRNANLNRMIIIMSVFFLFLILQPSIVNAEPTSGIEINFSGENDLASSVDVFLMITMLSFLPALLISMTSYVQIIMVLSLTRQALGTNTAPPNLVLSGMALVLTLFIMSPVISDINEVAYKPYKEGEVEFTEALAAAEVPLKTYMVNNASEDYIQMYAKIAGVEGEISNRQTVPFLVASAANVTTQITKALGLGAILMLSFVVIDMVVATVLMLLGMFMLPPQMISLPIKIITFLAAGGFTLIIEVVMQGIEI